jgi:PBP1b-binding outer membrane lipoprotein LpoB
MGQRSTYLSPPDLHRLDWACRPIAVAFGEPPYLVGSVLTRPDFRDIDIRLILDDDTVQRMFADHPRARLLLNIALTDLIARAANAPAPIDFQIQSMTEANVSEHGARNQLGVR